MPSKTSSLKVLALLSLATLFPGLANSTDFFDMLRKVPIPSQLQLPNIATSFTTPKPPDGIESSLKTIYPWQPLLEGTDPTEQKKAPRIEGGMIFVEEGFYSVKLQSYCLMAGTYQPKQ